MTLQKVIDNFEEGLGITFSIIMCTAVTLGVLSRMIGAPLAWTNEVARYVFIWMVMMGAVVATKRNGHIIIDVFINLFPQHLQQILKFIGTLIMIAMLSVLVYNGAILTYEFWGTKMSLLPYPTGLVYASLPVCSLLMILRMLQNMLRGRRNRLSAHPATKEAAQ